MDLVSVDSGQILSQWTTIPMQYRILGSEFLLYDRKLQENWILSDECKKRWLGEAKQHVSGIFLPDVIKPWWFPSLHNEIFAVFYRLCKWTSQVKALWARLPPWAQKQQHQLRRQRGGCFFAFFQTHRDRRIRDIPPPASLSLYQDASASMRDYRQRQGNVRIKDMKLPSSPRLV